jgi:hypothetical protein
MKPRRDITPYMSSSDSGINASLTLSKLYKRIRLIDPGDKPSSRYQARLKHRLAARRMKRGIVR